MYVDKLLLVSNEQAITVKAPSDYSIDLKAARKVWGGKQLYMVIGVDETFATKTSVNFQVVTDTVPTLVSPTVQIETGAIGVGSLTAGRAPMVIPIGSAIGTEEQYLGVYYIVAGTESGNGKVTTFVAFDAPSTP